MPMLIVSYPANRLGNCLRSILSTKILAGSIGADFTIEFRPGRCPENVAKIVRMLFPDCFLKGPVPPSIRELHERSCMRFVSLYGTNSDPVVEAVFNPPDSFPKEGFGLLHIYSARPDQMKIADYILAKHTAYGQMPFPAFLTEKVGEFCRRYTIPNAIGMHIRYTDNLVDPLKAELNAPLPVLEQKLRRVLAADNRVLLCSDNRWIKGYFASTYGPSIILPDAVDPDFQPLYEMMLLAQTAKVIGTYSSAFSYEACLFKGTDLELFEAGIWKRYHFSFVRFAARR